MPEPTQKRGAVAGAAALFQTTNKKRHPRLFLPKYLAEEADRLMIDAAELQRVGAILKQWAESARDGHLDQKELAERIQSANCVISTDSSSSSKSPRLLPMPTTANAPGRNPRSWKTGSPTAC
jgi:hypothetical protein